MGVVIVEVEGAVVGVNLGRPILTNGDFVAYLCKSDVLFTNDFGSDLLMMMLMRVAAKQSICCRFRSQDSL